MAAEIRIYVRTIATALTECGLLRGMPSAKAAPPEYWKFLPESQAANVAAGKAKRSPEFLADTSAALRFADVFFVPATMNPSGLADGVDIVQFCECLRGPVLTRERKSSFLPGVWVPLDFQFHEDIVAPVSPGVGKRMARAILAHFRIGTAHAPDRTSASTMALARALGALGSPQMSSLWQSHCSGSSQMMLACVLGGPRRFPLDWSEFWSRYHGQPLTRRATNSDSGVCNEEFGLVPREQLAVLWSGRAHQHRARLQQGISYVIGTMPGPQQDLEYEMLDLNMQHGLCTSAKWSRATYELCNFLHILVHGLLDCGMVTSLKPGLSAIPDEYFAGPSRTKFLDSMAATVKFIDTYLQPLELKACTRIDFDAGEFVSWVQGVMRRSATDPWEYGEHVPVPSIQWSFADEAGAGHQAALVVLRRYNLLQHTHIRTRLRYAEQEQHMLSEAISALNHECRHLDTPKRNTMFCVIADSCSKPGSSSRMLEAPAALAALESMSSSVSRTHADGAVAELQSTIDIRRVSDGTAAVGHASRAALLPSLRSNPHALSEAGVLYVLVPSLVRALGWEIVDIAMLIQLTSHSREVMPWAVKRHPAAAPMPTAAAAVKPEVSEPAEAEESVCKLSETVTELSSAERALSAILERFGAHPTEVSV